jgi:hypothetical protein
MVSSSLKDLRLVVFMMSDIIGRSEKGIMVSKLDLYAMLLIRYFPRKVRSFVLFLKDSHP